MGVLHTAISASATSIKPPDSARPRYRPRAELTAAAIIRLFVPAHKYTAPRRPLFGRSGRRLGLGPGHATPLAAALHLVGYIGAVVVRSPGRSAERLDLIPCTASGDPDLARDLAAAAARNPRSTWCVTLTDKDGHAVGHGCARPVRRRKPDRRDPPFTLTPADQPDLPGGYGTWRFTTGQQDLLIKIGPIPTGECDHRWEARGHDPGVMLRHLAEIRHATCTGPGCRRPANRCDFEHNIPYEAGGRTCLCNGDPKCRFDHRMKQDPRWNAEYLSGGYVRWTMPSGRQYVTEPTRYPV